MKKHVIRIIGFLTNPIKRGFYKLAIFILTLQNRETLDNFFERVGNVAKKKGKDYWTVEVEKSTSIGTDTLIVFTGYITDQSHEEGNTIEEVCKKLTEYNVLPSQITDVIL